MATTTTINSSYAGEVAGEIVGKAFKEADTIARNLVTILPNIAYKETVRKIDYGNGRTDFTCGFGGNGSVVLDEVVLEPKKLKNELEICKEDLRKVWDTQSMGFSAHNDSMPADEEQALLVEILAETAEATDADIWQGLDTTGHFEGFLQKFLGDSDVIKIASPVDITKSNVVAKLQAMTNAIPIALRRKTDLVFAVSPDVAQAYTDALIDASITNGYGGAQGDTLQYGRYTLEVVNGLPDSTMVVYQRKNLYFGTGLMADHNEIRIKDMDESNLTGTVRYKMVYTAGVAYVRGEEIVLYTTTTLN